jgi:hypothetical protein
MCLVSTKKGFGIAFSSLGMEWNQKSKSFSVQISVPKVNLKKIWIFLGIACFEILFTSCTSLLQLHLMGSPQVCLFILVPTRKNFPMVM